MPQHAKLVEVVAHRGASHEEPEHTLAAYLRALEDGADSLECDVRLTADGVLILVHDRRIDRTSSGSGTVSRRTLDELGAYAFNGPDEEWRNLESPVLLDAERSQVLTLERLLSTISDLGRPVGLAIETKHPTRFGKYVEEELAVTLAKFGLDKSRPVGTPAVRVMCFRTTPLKRVKRLLPMLDAVLLTERIPRKFKDGTLPHGVSISGTSMSNLRIDPDYVARCHANGHAVHVWTVDAPNDVRLCVELGVEAIITNRPAATLRLLGR